MVAGVSSPSLMRCSETMKVIAQTVSVECACGGQFTESERNSYMITSDTRTIECDACGKVIDWDKKAPKTARLFVA